LHSRSGGSVRWWFLILFCFIGWYLHATPRPSPCPRYAPVASEKGLVFSLRGHLEGQRLYALEKGLQAFSARENQDIVIHVDSSSGDLWAMLQFAQTLKEMRTRHGKQCTIYIQKAVGPAAILPFVANDILISPSMSWGNIPHRSKIEIDREVLIEMVKALIEPDRSSSSLLEQVAKAMIDPYHQLVYDRGASHIPSAFLDFKPLILNERGMKTLRLTEKVMSKDEFRAAYLSDQGNGEENGERADHAHTLFRKYLSYSKIHDNLIGYLSIGNEHPIDQATYIYVKFALEEYKKRGVRFIVLYLNTPGGDVFSSMKIVDLLQKSDVRDHIPIIACIDPWAISAGAMLAYACRFIAVTDQSVMGAAEPVIIDSGGGSEKASEKTNSALRAAFKSLAHFYGRNPLLAEAMVDRDMTLVVRNHKLVQLLHDNDIVSNGHNPDTVITTQGKLLTLTSEQLLELKIADFHLPLGHTQDPISPQEERQGMWPAKKSLVFQEPYLSHIPRAMMISHRDWRIQFFSVLLHPVIASCLLVGLIIGLYIEINTPGFGLAGSMALTCLILILLSNFSVHIVHWLEIVILLMGCLFLALELFVIPGFGIVGMFGILLTIVGLCILMIPGMNTLNLFDLDTLQLFGTLFLRRLAWFCGALLLSALVIIFLAKCFSHRFFRFSKLILKEEPGVKLKSVSQFPTGLIPEVGSIGETMTPLRPSGKISIGKRPFDAMTQGVYLEAHVVVEITRVEGNRMIVRAIGKEK